MSDSKQKRGKKYTYCSGSLFNDSLALERGTVYWNKRTDIYAFLT